MEETLLNSSRESPPEEGGDASPGAADNREEPLLRENLNRLSKHSKGKREALRSKRLLTSHITVSIWVGVWTVLLSSPVIVWPVGWQMLNGGCAKLTRMECILSEECNFLWSTTRVCLSRDAGFLNMWSTMILQFIFSVYTDYGSSVKFTIQGFVGTLLALLNVLMMNHIPRILIGGAFRTAIQPFDRDMPPNSHWLPLCNDGRIKLDGSHPTHCFLNIWWSELTWMSTLRVSLIWLDFVGFVAWILMSGFSANTRMFALSTHTYFMMSFVDPSKDDFRQSPSGPVKYFAMVAAAAFAAIACFWLPQCKKRFTALEAAEHLGEEAYEAASLLIDSLSHMSSQLMRQKAASALQETNMLLSELVDKLEYSWFEDFGWDCRGCCGRSRYRRRGLRKFAACARAAIKHVPSVHTSAAHVTAADWVLLKEHFDRTNACGSAARLLSKSSPPSEELQAEFAQARSAAAKDFEVLEKQLSDAARAYLFTIYHVLADVESAVHVWARASHSSGPRGVRTCRNFVCGLLHTFRQKFDWQVALNDPTHPRFVIRNTLSISFAFFIGWLGLWNVIPAYSYYAANTICVVMYTYTGSSAPITVKRVSAVVLGKVTGSIIQLAFGCRSVWQVSLYTLSMFSLVTFSFFLYLHMDQDMAYVSCLAAAFIASSMIPAEFQLRDCEQVSMSSVAPGLMDTIVCTVIGVMILTAVDLTLGSSASHQAQQRLMRCLSQTAALLSTHPPDRKKTMTSLMADLDKLRDVIPYAKSEPTLAVISFTSGGPHSWRLMTWREPFKCDLFISLESQLRKIWGLLECISWALRATDSSNIQEIPLRHFSIVAPRAPDSEQHETPTEVAQDPRFNELFSPFLSALQGCVVSLHALTQNLTEKVELQDSTLWDDLQQNLYTGRALRLLGDARTGVLSSFKRRNARADAVAGDGGEVVASASSFVDSAPSIDIAIPNSAPSSKPLGEAPNGHGHGVSWPLLAGQEQERERERELAAAANEEKRGGSEERSAAPASSSSSRGEAAAGATVAADAPSTSPASAKAKAAASAPSAPTPPPAAAPRSPPLSLGQKPRRPGESADIPRARSAEAVAGRSRPHASTVGETELGARSFRPRNPSSFWMRRVVNEELGQRDSFLSRVSSSLADGTRSISALEALSDLQKGLQNWREELLNRQKEEGSSFSSSSGGRLPNESPICNIELLLQLSSALALETSNMQLAVLQFKPEDDD